MDEKKKIIIEVVVGVVVLVVVIVIVVYALRGTGGPGGAGSGSTPSSNQPQSSGTLYNKSCQFNISHGGSGSRRTPSAPNKGATSTPSNVAVPVVQGPGKSVGRRELPQFQYQDQCRSIFAEHGDRESGGYGKS